MRRLLAPGGHLVLTIHGEQSVAYYGQVGARPPRQLEQIRSELYRRGFWFAPEFGEAGDFGVKHPGMGDGVREPRNGCCGTSAGAGTSLHYAVGRNAGNQDVVGSASARVARLPDR